MKPCTGHKLAHGRLRTGTRGLQGITPAFPVRLRPHLNSDSWEVGSQIHSQVLGLQCPRLGMSSVYQVAGSSEPTGCGDPF